jgi:signal transduction histidine kinase
MSLRAKLFPASVVACAAALVLVCFAQYRRGLRSVDDALRADAEARAHRFARAFETQRDFRLVELSELADAEVLDKFWVGIPYPWETDSLATQRRKLAEAQARMRAATSENIPVSDDLRAVVSDFFGKEPKVYSAVSFVTGSDVVVRFEPTREGWGDPTVKRGELPPGVKDYPKFFAGAVREETPLRPVWRTTTTQGALVYILPVAWPGDAGGGDVIAELRPDALAGLAAEEQGGANERSAGGASQSRTQLIALARDERIVYHPNDALKFQPVAQVMPYFGGVASEMAAGHEGSRDYVDADGARWIAAYAPVADLDLAVAVTANETAATAAQRREGRAYVALSALLALAVASLVFVREVRSARRIESIAQAARAVAEGDLDRRLEVAEGDRARSIAESFNLMTERLREHIRREAEGRQFHAFMRLSATLTHDLKNAITGLSMLVSNMERQWERAEFRADAVASLRDAAEKLNRIVARLSKPVETLSGEYRNALRPVDLAPVVRRVVEATAGRSSFHEVEMNLPDGLEVVADVERIERVFENLVINALEAMGASAGRLTVEGGREGEQSVFVSVADTGAGMTPEFIRTRLFRPFATTKKQGLGLGLYTCREVVEAHGGRIEVESRPSSGTRFRVVLPSRPASLPRTSK